MTAFYSDSYFYEVSNSNRMLSPMNLDNSCLTVLKECVYQLITRLCHFCLPAATKKLFLSATGAVQMKSVYFLTSAEKCSTEYPLTPFLHGLFADYGKKMQWKICVGNQDSCAALVIIYLICYLCVI